MDEAQQPIGAVCPVWDWFEFKQWSSSLADLGQDEVAKVGRLVETNGFMVDLAMTLAVIAADLAFLPKDHPGLQPEAITIHIGTAVLPRR